LQNAVFQTVVSDFPIVKACQASDCMSSHQAVVHTIDTIKLRGREIGIDFAQRSSKNRLAFTEGGVRETLSYRRFSPGLLPLLSSAESGLS
jgi:hypothetical protein